MRRRGLAGGRRAAWVFGLGLLFGALLLGGSPDLAVRDGALVFAEDDSDEAPDPTAVTATPTPREAAPAPAASPVSNGGALPAERGAAADPGAPEQSATPSPQPSPTPRSTPVPPGAYPLPDDQPPDYAVPNGHFFSQAVPGARPGFGFSVADAAGVPLWSEYRRLGGLQDLGYPISRRFVWGRTVAQAFQGAVLRWRADRARADLDLLDNLGKLPNEAIQPEPPARLGGAAARQPWSGWWWPATSLVGGPHLFDLDGPLAKYDRFVARNGRDDPRTLEWEQSELWLDDLDWAGHCNGWSAAALLEDEPTEARDIGGVHFGISDLKGLLSAYHFADSAAWLHGGPDDDVSPVDLHRRLVDWIGNGRKGFVLTFRPSRDEEVWSFPAYRFELLMGPDPDDPDVTHVEATVWLADNDVPAEYVGVRPWRGQAQTYRYYLLGPRDAPTGGDWEGSSVGGGFAHPSFLWYPDPEHRNLDRALSSPNLEYRTIRRILKPR